MKSIKYLFAALFILMLSCKVSAQNSDGARTLIKEGQKLNDEKKYTEAIEKYRQALMLDTGNLFAGYQLANSLFLSDKGVEGIPYLRKITQTDNKLTGPAYDLLGLIYFKNKRYAEAETATVSAIKIDPKHASTQRMYALVSFHQNKRAQAFLGFCSFILLEPNTARSAEAYGNMQHIIQGGSLKAEPGEMQSHAIEANVNALNEAITQALAYYRGKKLDSPGNLLNARLIAIFTSVGKLAEKQTGNDFFRNYLAAYFYKLAQSPNMPAFARLVSASERESADWIKAHPQQMADLDNWMKNTEREF